MMNKDAMRASVNWPPATLGMSLAELVKLRQIANETLAHLEPLIVASCTKVGHAWDSVSGRRVTERQPFMGGFSDDEDCDDLPAIRYYVRKCKRCGVINKEEEVTSTRSPFA